MTLQQEPKHIDCRSKEQFSRMTVKLSFELIEAKSDSVCELGNNCVSLELQAKGKFGSCNSLIILHTIEVIMHRSVKCV